MTPIIKFSFVILTLIYSNLLVAQEYKKDVQSLESIMTALTEVISGPAEQARDWNRFKYLFSNDAKLIPTQRDEDGVVTYQYWSPDEYINMYKNTRGGTSFYEQELFRITESFGNIAHCFSTYAVRTEKNGPIERRGINSIQLLKAKDRWFIMSVFWSNESQDEKLPEKYLKQ